MGTWDSLAWLRTKDAWGGAAEGSSGGLKLFFGRAAPALKALARAAYWNGTLTSGALSLESFPLDSLWS